MAKTLYAIRVGHCSQPFGQRVDCLHLFGPRFVGRVGCAAINRDVIGEDHVPIGIIYARIFAVVRQKACNVFLKS